MIGMPARASDEYNKYTSQLQGVTSAAEGQLLFLNHNLRSVILDDSGDLNARYYRASLIYVQILRVIYTMDRVHDLTGEFWKKTSENLNYVSGVANIDTHLFLKQVRASCAFTGSENLMYRTNGLMQKAEINKDIIDQASLWLTKNNKDFIISGSDVSSFFLSGSYASAISSLQKDGGNDTPADSSQTDHKSISEDFVYIMHNLKESLMHSLGSNKVIRSLPNHNATSFKCYIHTKDISMGPNLDLNSTFAKHFMSFRHPKKNYADLLDGLERNILDSVCKIGDEIEGSMSFVSKSSFLSGLGVSENSINMMFRDELKDHVKMEKAILPLLMFMQIKSLKSSFSGSSTDNSYSEKDLFLNFVYGNEIKLPEKISESEMKFFNSVLKNPDFMTNSLYDFYVALHDSHKSSSDKDSLKQASEYFSSTPFLSRLYWLSERADLLVHADMNEQSVVFRAMFTAMKQFAGSVRQLNNKPNSGVLPIEEWKTVIAWDATFNNLENYTAYYRDYTHFYNQPNLRSLVALDRYSYYSTKPLNDVELAVQPLMYSEHFINLPLEMKSKIISEYVLFEGNVLWHKEGDVLNHTFETLQRANDFGVAETIVISALRGRGGDVIINDHSAVFDVIAKGQNRALRMLLQKGVDLEQKNSEGLTPLQEAVRLDMLFSVKLIMKDILKRDKAQNGGGKHALPVALAVEHESIEVLSYFIDILGKDNIAPENFHNAVKKQSYPVVKLFLEAGFDPNLVDSHGKKAIDYVGTGGAELQELISGNAGDGVPINAGVRMVEKACADGKIGKGGLSKIKNVFAANSQGVSSHDLWIRRVCCLLFVLAVSSFVLAFIYPINLFLNLALVFSYTAVFFDMYKSNWILPDSPKVYEVMLDTGILGGSSKTSTNAVNNSLFFSLGKSDVLEVGKVDSKPAKTSEMERCIVGDRSFNRDGFEVADSSKSLNLVKV
jgi:hypothetical protein